MPKIYFDHAATTPVRQEVLDVMTPYYSEKFGNASSLHTFGQEAAAGIGAAREIVANFFGVTSAEVYFTSGATEANNLAVQGVTNWFIENKKVKPHIITSQIEHPAILEQCKYLEQRGLAEVTYLPVYGNGIVRVTDVIAAIRDNTRLITIMYANNEVGTIQPIAEIGQALIVIKEDRRAKKMPTIYFHTDAVQAVNFCDCNVEKLGVDLLSFSGHKIYGHKGVGGLIVKREVSIDPLFFGGHQEKSLRPGTYNTPAIIGLARALELVIAEKEQLIKHTKKIQEFLLDGFREKLTDWQLNGDEYNRLPNNLNISIHGVEGESLLIMLDMDGVAVSTGSACASGALEPSHVLLAMGIPAEIAHGSLRITLGRDNTISEAEHLLVVLPPIIAKLRKMAPDLSSLK